MKKVLLILLCVILAISSVACNKENNVEGGNVDGNNVGQITDGEAVTDENSSEAASSEPWVLVTYRTNSYLYDSYIYDDQGRITEVRTFNTRESETEPKSVTAYTYTFQADGSITVKAVTSATMEKEFSGFELIFNADGNCIEYKNYDYCKSVDDVFSEQSYLYTVNYEYDSNGNLLKSTHSGNNQIKSYTFDANGRLISYNKQENGNLFKSVDFTLDDKGNVIKEAVTGTSEDGSVFEYRTNYEYDGDLLLKKTMKNSDNKGNGLYITTYKYDDNGKMIETTIETKRDGYIPFGYFAGNGYLIEGICFPMTGCIVTFIPLSQALLNQSK